MLFLGVVGSSDCLKWTWSGKGRGLLYWEGTEDNLLSVCRSVGPPWSQSWDLARPAMVMVGFGGIGVVSADSIARLVPGLREGSSVHQSSWWPCPPQAGPLLLPGLLPCAPLPSAWGVFG